MRNIVFFLMLVVVLSFGGKETLSFLFPSTTGEVLAYVGAYCQIAIGALLYLTTKYYGPYFSKRKIMSFVIMLMGLCILMPVYFCELERLNNYLIATGVYLFLLGGIHLPFFQLKSLKIFLSPGRYSYGNYLLHIVIPFMIHSFLWNLNIVVAFVVYTVVATALAAVSFRFFEVPANRFIRKLFEVKIQSELKMKT